MTVFDQNSTNEENVLALSATNMGPIQVTLYNALVDYRRGCVCISSVRTGWHDRDPQRHSIRRGSVGVALRLLSGARIRGNAHKARQRRLSRARTEFESAWRIFLAKRTETDFQTWRDQQAWTAEKYRRFNRGERMPHDWRASG